MTPQVGERVKVDMGMSPTYGTQAFSNGKVVDYQRGPGGTQYKVQLDEGTSDWYHEDRVKPMLTHVSPHELVRAAKGELEPAANGDAFVDHMLWLLGRDDWRNDSLLAWGVD